MIINFAERASAYLESGGNRDEIQKYIEIYLRMMELLRRGDVSNNGSFQKLYNVFYKLRFSGSNGHTSNEIYTAYYRLLEAHKHDEAKPDIESVLLELRDLTGNVHLSFASKLIGTLYPETAPIWDNNVRVLLDIPYRQTPGGDRLVLAAEAYHTLEARYTAFSAGSEAENVTRVFDDAFPGGRGIAPWKKIDFLLWRMGSRKSRNSV